MLVLSFPHAIALGLLAGLLEFIPVAGWMISATSIVTLGVLTHSHWIWMAALLALWRMLMDYWIAPRVMGHELEIHPLLAIFAVMMGGAIGGIVGVYLSSRSDEAARWAADTMLKLFHAARPLNNQEIDH
jgi:predicted PurR-regulated permease PerM